ncbi:conserved hypothetical protein [Vibrio nigripulchritudo SOn1]|uniref:Outer membrane lipoprotein n=1 Tax=Vibrio nigripulchritudo SOn1 TaxID=1238450 RepID=A0AAV2VZP2_9VIBR|nr:DUF4156 domain-containing protein [Vibrio nigripulchritudo]CCO49975.1 conserved hypothetical protein [Vibrio nigripulchritudo SOn1]
MLKFIGRAIFLVSVLALAACSTPSQRIQPNAQHVSVYADSAEVDEACQWKGELTGSEGHWYSFLFFNNDAMIQGAVNDLKNQASSLGANRVYLNSPIHFKTSVTFFGNAYFCP